MPDTWRFSIDVARKWEEAFHSCPTPSTRKVKQTHAKRGSRRTKHILQVTLRSAMVMSPDAGGVFSVFSWLVRMGLGGMFLSTRPTFLPPSFPSCPLTIVHPGSEGSGLQYVSWIHGDDFARAIEFLINTESISGVVNVTSPNPVPNHYFLSALRKAWGVCIPSHLLSCSIFIRFSFPSLFRYRLASQPPRGCWRLGQSSSAQKLN